MPAKREGLSCGKESTLAPLRLYRGWVVIRTLSIKQPDGQLLHWNLGFSDRGTLQVGTAALLVEAPWARLAYCQCPACSLRPDICPTCPVAAILYRYARDLADRDSFEKVDVHMVLEDGRHVILKQITLQHVVSELVRLAVFQSACPVGRPAKLAMARLAPFPDSRDILTALAAFFAERGRRDASCGPPASFMEDLHAVFGCLCRRLEKTCNGDALLNAVVVLHSLSVLFTLSAPELIREAADRLPPAPPAS